MVALSTIHICISKKPRGRGNLVSFLERWKYVHYLARNTSFVSFNVILDVGGLLWITVDYCGIPNEIDLKMPSTWLLICAKG
jgi:hypothetical protein